MWIMSRWHYWAELFQRLRMPKHYCEWRELSCDDYEIYFPLKIEKQNLVDMRLQQDGATRHKAHETMAQLSSEPSEEFI